MQTKLIIFDLDGTFYDIEDVIENFYDLTIKYLMECHSYSYEDAKKLLNDNCIFPYVSKEAKSTTGLFRRLNYDIDFWNNYRSSRFSADDIKINHGINQELINEFKKKALVTLLTNNTLVNVEKVLNKLNISKDSFSLIKCNKETTKQKAMSEIMAKYQINPDNTLSIGDRYDVDALPMLKLKGHAIIINKPLSINRILKDFDNYQSNDEYKFY